MWQISGTLNEKLGRQVYRAWYVRSLGNGNYLRINKYYFSKDEKFHDANGGTYELHLENCKDHLGNVHTCYIDLDTGNPVALEDIKHIGKQVVYSPDVLHEMLNTDDIKAAVKASIGQNYGTLIVIMAAGLGLVIGILIGTNSGAITGLVTGGPTPTPHMVIKP